MNGLGNATRFLGLADWAFAFPPVRELPESRDAEYLLECDAGTTPQALLATLSRQSQTVTESALLSFLRDCVERGLMYEDEGKFLSLAVGTGNFGRHRKGAVPVPEPVHMAVPLISAISA
jgi:hypothetical protein